VSQLWVNIDHIATLRQARRGKSPEPIAAALIAEMAGADGIIVHLREDRRHIQDRDVALLRQVIRTKLNLEMANTEEMVRIALRIKPDVVTFVPERREELTTEGGLDVRAHLRALKRNIQRLKREGILCSLFIDADLGQVRASKTVGGNFIEIHTGHYCDAADEEGREMEFQRIRRAIQRAGRLGLRINVGHGLDEKNVGPFLAIPGIEHYSIGYSIICRAVLAGMEEAVKNMKNLIRGGGMPMRAGDDLRSRH
jgi:pyridoxine 5-phosphate synthase